MDQDEYAPSAPRLFWKGIKKRIPISLSLILMIVCTGLYFIYPGRYISLTYSISVGACEVVVVLFMFINFFLATFMDPGILPRSEEDEESRHAPIFKVIEVKGKAVRLKWCTTCGFYRPPRVTHCSSCDNCVERFDHHCPWVNNCVGIRNYRFFFWYITSLTLHMVAVLTQTIIYLVQNWRHDLAGFISSWVVIAVITFALPLVGALNGFHLFLVAMGRSTNEQVTGKFKAGHNPFDYGCLTNCCINLCGPRHPSYMRRLAKSKPQAKYSPIDEGLSVKFINAPSPTVGVATNEVADSGNHHVPLLSISTQPHHHQPPAQLHPMIVPCGPLVTSQEGGSRDGGKYISLADSRKSSNHSNNNACITPPPNGKAFQPAPALPVLNSLPEHAPLCQPPLHHHTPQPPRAVPTSSSVDELAPDLSDIEDLVEVVEASSRPISFIQAMSGDERERLVPLVSAPPQNGPTRASPVARGKRSGPSSSKAVISISGAEEGIREISV